MQWFDAFYYAIIILRDARKSTLGKCGHEVDCLFTLYKSRKELSGMENLIKLIVDNGLSVVCVAYLMYFQHTTMTKMLDTLNSIKERLLVIEKSLDADEE